LPALREEQELSLSEKQKLDMRYAKNGRQPRPVN